jgi:hypothetical protein
MGRTAFTEVKVRRKGYSGDIAKEQEYQESGRKKKEKRTETGKNGIKKEKAIEEN